jgi:hypothetical protein
MLVVLNLRTWTKIGRRMQFFGVSFFFCPVRMATVYCENGDEDLRVGMGGVG